MLAAIPFLALLLLLTCPATRPSSATTFDTTSLDLPPNHLPLLLHSFPGAIEYACAQHPQCVQQVSVQINGSSASAAERCWGYELGCRPEQRYALPAKCETHFPAASAPMATDAPASAALLEHANARAADTFFEQADFGYIREQSRQLLTICEPRFVGDSSLECSPHLRFCRARNIRVDFRSLANRTEPFRYRTDVLAAGAIGGRCRLHRERLGGQLEHMSALQSWAPEVQHFAELEASVDSGATELCDVFVDRPTFFLKIDAAFNMYHHFCDFFNLYASLHVNGTHPAAFSTDVQLLVWETYPYRSPFAGVWPVFSRHPVQTLNEVRGRRVCYRNLVLPLLPRMIFGLYYNTPIVKNCANSGLFQAFSEHILHRMRVPFRPPQPNGVLRITLLARLTKYRNIVNANELVAQLSRNASYSVQTVSFEKLDFAEQLAITRNTDIFIGMHGAGLTHLLFLPPWAALFELYNCNDESCYRDLARLRGVHYVTWQRADKLALDTDTLAAHDGHEKFTNYRFDAAEFVRLVNGAAQHVLGHQEYRKFVSGGGGGGGGGGDGAEYRDEL